MSGVTVVDAGARRVARRAEVRAAASEIFDLLADPHRHGELDGSGTVRATVSGPSRLDMGASFSVNMKQLGIPYRITSRVVAFERDRLIEWRHPLGHTWRWQLEPIEPTGTAVTETFDYSATRAARMFELSGRATTNGDGITRTLQQLQQRFER